MYDDDSKLDKVEKQMEVITPQQPQTRVAVVTAISTSEEKINLLINRPMRRTRKFLGRD